MLAPFIAHCVGSMDDIGDGRDVGRRSMAFQESFDKENVDGSDERWQWERMTNAHANVDDLEDYAGMSRILESWNPHIP